VVDQTTMSTPGVSHPSPTTAEDFRRVLDERAVQPVLQPVAAPVARDCGDGGPDDQRRFDVVVTHDRDLVIRAAEPLPRRLVPER
jgi:hypothetical protein